MIFDWSGPGASSMNSSRVVATLLANCCIICLLPSVSSRRSLACSASFVAVALAFVVASLAIFDKAAKSMFMAALGGVRRRPVKWLLVASAAAARRRVRRRGRGRFRANKCYAEIARNVRKYYSLPKNRRLDYVIFVRL